MTKTLTEQWREGKLTDGIYYVSLRDSNDIHIRYLDQTKYSVYFKCFKEVLAAVPSYDEYRELLDLNVYEKDRKKVMGLEDKIKRLQEQKQKVIALIKDGRFVEALQELEK